MAELAKTILKKASELIHSHDFLIRHRKGPADFIRKRKLEYTAVILITLGIITKSSALAIDDFYENVEIGKTPCSKQAFSRSRAKISPEAYKELFKLSAEEVSKANAIGREGGYRIFAIDGTYLMLPQSKAIREKFKPISGSYLPHARASFFYDVLSGFILDACFDNVETSERTMALSHLEAMKGKLGQKDIILADRGYPSKEMIECLTNSAKYISRLQKSFSAEIDESTQNDFDLGMVNKGKTTMVRVIKNKHEGSDSDMILITNLSRDEWSAEEINECYTKRWPIETRFADMKIKIEAENFSGKTSESLEQDFYARVFLMNVESAIKLETDARIHAGDEKKITQASS